MNDNNAVPYPTAGFAYPVAKPVPAFPVAQAPVVEATVPAPAPAVSEAPTPAVFEVAAPSASVAETTQPTETTQQPATQTQESPKFFPLVPTETSKFVSTEPPTPVTTEPATEGSSEPQLESPFDISSSLTREPQTNSIVLDEIPDALTVSDIVTDAGQILATGSIELPTLTGEVTVVSDSPEADQADLLDSASVTISTVAPVRAPSVINSKAQLGVLPSKRRKNQGQLMAMLTLAIMIVTVGTLYAMAAILGFIK